MEVARKISETNQLPTIFRTLYPELIGDPPQPPGKRNGKTKSSRERTTKIPVKLSEAKTLVLLDAYGYSQFRTALTPSETIDFLLRAKLGIPQSQDLSEPIKLRYLEITTGSRPRGANQPDLKLLAQEAIDASERVARDGFWSESRTFISDAYDELASSGKLGELSESAFKAHLTRAHKAGLLTLLRADIVVGLPLDRLRRSRLEIDGDTFAFIARKRNINGEA